MAELFIPTLHTFENENVFTGSYGPLRFKITPSVDLPKGAKELIRENSSIQAEVWHGILCYEKSEIEQEKEFPMTEDGRQAMIEWLLSCV